MAGEASSFSGSLGSTSTGLLARVRLFDGDSWRRLSALYGPLVYRWARVAGLSEDDAADVGQEVFRTVAARIGSFRNEDPDDTFRGWLWTITRNKVGDFLRRRSKHPTAIGGSDAQYKMNLVVEPIADGSFSGSSGEQSLLHRAVRLIESEFEPKTWQAFWRATVDAQPTDAIAADLQMTSKAVRQAKYRVLKRLRREVDGLVD